MSEQVAVKPHEYASTIRQMIQHENDLTSQRLGWMSTLNGLLFTALGLVWNKSNSVLLVVILCCLGLVVCLSSLVALRAADHARQYLHRLWLKKGIERHLVPPVIAWSRKRIPLHETRRARLIQWLRPKLMPWNALPYAFMVAWVCLLIMGCVHGPGWPDALIPERAG